MVVWYGFGMDYILGAHDSRPWGTWRVVHVGEGCVVKEILVRAGEVLSLQRHKYRGEHWIIIKGEATVTRGEKVKICPANTSVFIERGMWHRVQNDGRGDLVFIEIQTGEILDEDDIERKEDRYGRR